MQKSIFSGLVILAVTGISTSVIAGDLTIVNNTNHPSTALIHTAMGPACSKDLPIEGGGVTPPKTTRVIPQGSLSLACVGQTENCVAEVFMTPDCNASGAAPISTVTFSLTTGIKSAVPSSNQGYTISFSGFTITADGD